MGLLVVPSFEVVFSVFVSEVFSMIFSSAVFSRGAAASFRIISCGILITCVLLLEVSVLIARYMTMASRSARSFSPQLPFLM